MSIKDELIRRGVRVVAPETVEIAEDVRPDRIASGVTLWPNVRLSGAETLLMEGTELGALGGGSFHNIACGPRVSLGSGLFSDAVFLDGVTLRGHAEVRGGSLLEEGCEGAHHVGYKMTIMMPFVIAGSLVNFCDVFVAGGTGRKDHSEIGSTLALYNFTPWGDKFASRFGDVPRGVFLRSPRIFVGGQTQIVSPVHVGYGSVIAAGMAVRRDVPAGRLYGEVPRAIDAAFDVAMLGAVTPKMQSTIAYVGHLRALERWYEQVRLPSASGLRRELYARGLAQVRAGVRERIKRLNAFVGKLQSSRDAHVQAMKRASDTGQQATHRRRIADHSRWIEAWPTTRSALEHVPTVATPVLDEVMTAIAAYPDYLEGLGALDEALVSRGVSALERVVAEVVEAATPSR